MSIRTTVQAALLAATALGATAATADFEEKALVRNHKVYAEVVLYDVLPGKAREFENILLAPGEAGRSGASSLVNDRVMRNIDDVTLQYATYTKFVNPDDAEKATEARLSAVRHLLRRAPEKHLVQLDRSYVPAGTLAEPKGKEFGSARTGQIAHLGLFLPSPKNTREYYESLYKVKEHTVARQPKGYLGDDLLIEPAVTPIAKQSPYTPRPAYPTRLSVNYGEYDTLEDAEDSYVDRSQARTPELVTLERMFYSSLQVPNRFYIFKVIGNY